MSSSEPFHVEEVPGEYGPVAVPEILLQKIWLRQDFEAGHLRLLDGRSLRVLSPGRWNRQGGPDFLGAEIEVAGQTWVGDIEMHFHPRDWAAHRHAQNTDFDRVVLHVVLFPPRSGETPAATASGEEPPVLLLLPYLREDLESYALQDALHVLENGNIFELAAPFLEAPVEVRRAQLLRLARGRWTQKLGFASRRLERLGWEEACHVAALEVLGYRRNRRAMVQLAEAWPLREMGKELPSVDALYARVGDAWVHGAQRPANQPRRRLEQYRAWIAVRRQWPEALRTSLDALEITGSEHEASGLYRHRNTLAGVREIIRHFVCGDAVAGSRFDTLVVDAFLPLFAAHFPGHHLFPLWFHWYAGDAPDKLRFMLELLEVSGQSRDWPLTNGWIQAGLAILIENGDL